MKRVLAAVATIVFAACGDASARGDGSPGPQPAPMVKPAAVAASTVPLTVQPTTSAATTVPATTVPATTMPPTSVPVTTAAPTTVPSTTTAVVLAPAPATGDGSVLAIDVLAFVTVENEHRGGYARDLFGYPADLDNDGCDTRSEVLQRDSIAPAQVDPFGCTVVQGDWTSVYDGLTTMSPGELEIDHVVSLKEAWDSGAWSWNAGALVAYANDLSDPRGLRAVSVSANRAKGDKDPSNWLPPDPDAVCPFISDWVAIKARWGLSMDQSEHGRIRNLLSGPCAGWRISALEPLPASTAPAPSAPIPLVDPPTTGVYYANCTAARAAGAAPIHVGEPGYRPALDGDKDGIACE